jgi:hypothetical protein
LRYHVKSLKDVKDVCVAYRKLTTAVDFLNDSFGSTGALLLVAVTLYNIYAAFTYYRYIREGQATELIIKNIIWGATYTTLISSMLYVTNSLLIEARQTAHTAHERIQHTDHQKAIDELSTLSQLVNDTAPVVGIWSTQFDFRLLHTIVSVIVSYLVILIQFDSSVESKLLKAVGNN